MLTRENLKVDRLDRRQPVVGQIVSLLRADIISLHLEPGTALSRAALAERFGVSQTPIREALLQLEQQGLIDVYPQSGTLVSLIDVEQAYRSQFLRIALECEVAHTLASNPSRYDLRPAEETIEEMRANWLHTNDARAIRPSDQQFHALLFEAVGQGELWDIVQARSGNVDRMRSINIYPGKAERVIAEHTAWIAAIRAGDPQRARETVRTHLSDTLRAVDQMRAAYPHYFLA